MKKILPIIVAVLVGFGISVLVNTCQDTTDYDHKVDDSKARVEAKADSVRRVQALEDSLKGVMKHDSLVLVQKIQERDLRISKLEKKLRAQDFSRYQAPQLDSVVLALYPIQNDTSYCMPIDASRDALEALVVRPIYEDLLVENAAKVWDLKEANVDMATKYERRLTLKNVTIQLKDDIIDEKDLQIKTREDQNRTIRQKGTVKTIIGIVGGVAIGIIIGK